MQHSLSRLTIYLGLLCSISIGQQSLAQAPDAEEIFNSNCAACHVQQAGENIPDRAALEALEPNAILRTLTDGAMRLQGTALSQVQRISIAEHLSGKPLLQQTIKLDVGMCAEIPTMQAPVVGNTWNGWGNDGGNTRYQTDTGGLSATDIPNLTLKWAFGIPDITQARSQPAVYAERLFIGSLCP